MESLLPRPNISNIQRERERFVRDMVLKFNVSKATVVFKIALKNLINDFSKIRCSLLPLYYIKKNLKLSKEICKENASEFK